MLDEDEMIEEEHHYALTDPQAEIFLSESRFKVAACGRRFGKTYLSIFTMLDKASVPNSKVWYVTSSYRAAKQIIWETLKTILLPLGYIDKVNESELTLKLVNGSSITLRGSDNYDSLRGVGLAYLVIDEASYCEEKAWKEALRPTLSDTGGGALFISSPSGRDWFYNLWLKGRDENEPSWESWQFTTIEGGNVPQEEIDAARRDLDERTFQQEYEAKFVDYYGIIYYNFDRDCSLKEWEYMQGKTLYIGIDFNVDPMSAVIGQRKGDDIFIFDEIVLYSSNTDEMATEISERYPIQDCILYPDPAASQRRTSAGGKTDISILSSYGFKVRHRNSHPFVRDRINAVNARLKSSIGNRHLFVSSKCRNLIQSLERMSYKEGSSVPDKSQGFDHLCDSLGYMIEYIFPVNHSKPVKRSRVGGF